MYTCPHCEKTGVSRLRKLCLGPAVPGTCRACGEKVGVPWSAMWAVAPFVLAIFMTQMSEIWPTKLTILAVGLVVMSIIHLVMVPLIRR